MAAEQSAREFEPDLAVEAEIAALEAAYPGCTNISGWEIPGYSIFGDNYYGEPRIRKGEALRTLGCGALTAVAVTAEAGKHLGTTLLGKVVRRLHPGSIIER